MQIKTADIVNSNLWKLFPVINVDKVKDIDNIRRRQNLYEVIDFIKKKGTFRFHGCPGA